MKELIQAKHSLKLTKFKKMDSAPASLPTEKMVNGTKPLKKDCKEAIPKETEMLKCKTTQKFNNNNNAILPQMVRVCLRTQFTAGNYFSEAMRVLMRHVKPFYIVHQREAVSEMRRKYKGKGKLTASSCIKKGFFARRRRFLWTVNFLCASVTGKLDFNRFSPTLSRIYSLFENGPPIMKKLFLVCVEYSFTCTLVRNVSELLMPYSDLWCPVTSFMYQTVVTQTLDLDEITDRYIETIYYDCEVEIHQALRNKFLLLSISFSEYQYPANKEGKPIARNARLVNVIGGVLGLDNTPRKEELFLLASHVYDDKTDCHEQYFENLLRGTMKRFKLALANVLLLITDPEISDIMPNRIISRQTIHLTSIDGIIGLLEKDLRMEYGKISSLIRLLTQFCYEQNYCDDFKTNAYLPVHPPREGFFEAAIYYSRHFEYIQKYFRDFELNVPELFSGLPVLKSFFTDDQVGQFKEDFAVFCKMYPNAFLDVLFSIRKQAGMEWTVWKVIKALNCFSRTLDRQALAIQPLAARHASFEGYLCNRFFELTRDNIGYYRLIDIMKQKEECHKNASNEEDHLCNRSMSRIYRYAPLGGMDRDSIFPKFADLIGQYPEAFPLEYIDYYSIIYCYYEATRSKKTEATLDWIFRGDTQLRLHVYAYRKLYCCTERLPRRGMKRRPKPISSRRFSIFCQMLMYSGMAPANVTSEGGFRDVLRLVEMNIAQQRDNRGGFFEATEDEDEDDELNKKNKKRKKKKKKGKGRKK